ncbi:glutaminase [Microbacterium sp. NPDC057650]|uniref:glutaminase n=1 Tax=unclassified Microbacterium TaxID=2609290 RepID=UPI00366AEA05
MTTAALLAAIRERLADAPMQGLGVAKVSRWRAPRIVRVGAAWHLGVLLLTRDGVLATGEVLRAAEEVRRGYAAESARARADRRAQARRGDFGEGEVVHVGWAELDADAVESGPLLTVDGVPMVRWSAGGIMPLEAYLNEQIELRYPGR